MAIGNGASPHDPNADYGRLWLAVHDYLTAQAAEPPEPTDLARAYAELVSAHNMIHDRYVAHSEAPPRIAGL